MDIVEFLTACIDEEQALAEAATQGHWYWNHGLGEMCSDKDCPYGQLIAKQEGSIPTVLWDVHGWDVKGGDKADADHIAFQDPARVLRRIAGQRRILDRWKEANHSRYDLPSGAVDGRDPDERLCDEAVALELDWVIEVMANEYSDRPGFNPQWSLT